MEVAAEAEIAAEVRESFITVLELTEDVFRLFSPRLAVREIFSKASRRSFFSTKR